MAIDPGRGERLNSWKEIAAALRVDKRTCARWEKSLGLPVRRIEGFDRSRVYAYRDEIEAWAKEKLQGGIPNGRGERPGRGALRLPGIGLVLAGLAAGFALVPGSPLYRFWADREPAGLEVVPGRVRAFNRDRDALWDFALPDHVKPNLFRHAFFDIDLDGRRETILGYTREAGDVPFSEVVCLSRRGDVLWKKQPTRSLALPGHPYTSEYTVWSIHAFRLPNEGAPRVSVISTNAPWDPCLLTLYDGEGNKTGEFANRGHWSDSVFEYRDFDGDGREEILVAGVNNAYERACLAVLDPERVEGASPQDVPGQSFVGLRTGPVRYLLFPRSLLNEKLDVRNRVVTVEVHPQDRRIDVTVMETVRSPQPAIKYQLDYDLRPISAIPEDDYRRALKELQFEGKIGPYGDKEIDALADRIQSWDGRGWATLKRDADRSKDAR